MRIMDVDARKMTSAHDDGAPHPGRESVLVSLKGSFHGRTDRPAQASDSCQPAYRKYLASFRGDRQVLHTVEPNNVNQLREVFEEVRVTLVCAWGRVVRPLTMPACQIDSKGLHVEAMLMEPVMGEGNPGVAITRDFYDTARELTDEYVA